MVTKDELRKKALQIRSILDLEPINAKIVESILTAEIFSAAQNIMIFYPLKDEINLLPLMDSEKSKDKNFYLPRVEGDKLLVCPYKKGDKLSKSEFNTKEPISEAVNPDILDLIFVPALMVDKEFHRLGYGKGFYDRFLNANALKAIRIVPIPSLLIKDEIPYNEFDAQFDIILDEL